MHMMTTQDGRGYGPLEDAKIPSQFEKVVESILGLSPMFAGHQGPIILDRADQTRLRRLGKLAESQVS